MNVYHGTKTNITPSTFHYEGSDVPYSFQNSVGFSKGYEYLDTTTDFHNTHFKSIPAAGRMEFWITYQSFSGDLDFLGGVVVGSERCAFGVSPTTNRLLMYIGDQAGIEGSTALSVGQTYKVSMEWGSGTAEIFIDDVSDSTGSYSGDPTQTLDFTIGARNANGVMSFGSSQTIHRFRLLDGDDETLYDTNSNGFGEKVGSPTFSPIPRDESDTTNAVFGLPLTESGRVPRNAELTKSACLSFDGVDDVVVLGSTVSLTGDFDIEFWIDPVSTNIILSGLTGSTGFELQVSSTGIDVLYNGSNQGSILNGDIRSEGWVHIRVSRVGSTVTGYKNGYQHKSITLSGTCDIGYLGARDTSLELEGDLCGVKITDAGSVIHYWPASSGDGTRVYDVVGNNHGTATNITISTFWGTQDVFHYNITEGHNRSWKYDGVNDYHDTGFNSLPAEGSYEVWATVGDDLSCEMSGIVGSTNKRCSIGLSSGRPLGRIANLPLVVGTTVVSAGDDVRLKMTWSSGTARIFLNGVEENSLSFTGAPDDSYNNCMIGARSNNGSPNIPTDATIHRVRIADDDDTTLFDTNVDGFGTVGASPDLTRVPSKSNGNDPIFGNTVTRPAGGHNDAETHLDFTGGESDQPWTDQLWKGFAEFDGTTSSYYLSTTIANTTLRKISCWIRTTSTSTHRIWGTNADAGFGLEINNTEGEVRVVSNSVFSSSSSGADLNDGEWHFLEVVNNGTKIVVKVDDNEVLNEAYTNPFLDTGTFTIGVGDDSPTTGYFDGDIKDVEVKNDSNVVIGKWPLKSHYLDVSGTDNHASPQNSHTLNKGPALETDYEFADGRTHPHYVTQTAKKEDQFHTMG